MPGTGALTRRGLLTGLGAVAASAALPGFAAARPDGRATPTLLRAADRSGLAATVTFPDGVMAGMPTLDGATLWTRVPRGPFQSAARLALVVSRHADLHAPEVVTTVDADGETDGCVHVPVSGLRPGEQYHYRFAGRDDASATGSFRTLRPADSAAPVRIGFVTCQSYTEGYYAAHRHLAEEDVDLVVGLGDYVYEASVPGVRGIDLNLYPQTLGAMRSKYSAYRSDPDLRAMHARHAFVPMWDDHEFRNNYDRVGWTLPVLSVLDTLLFFRAKRAWAWRAWFEHMPIPRMAEDPLRTYRRLRLGRHVELFTQDARQFRDDQPCGDPLVPAVCPDADTAGRSMLGAEQKAWLLAGLRESSATWKVLANANMMMGMAVSDDGARSSMDTWNGYGAERTELLSAIAAGIRDVVVVTGDEHETYAAELWDTGFAPGSASGAQENRGGTRRAAVEFVVPSISSPNTGDISGPEAADTEGRARLERNPHIRAADLAAHGYGLLTADTGGVRFRYRTVDCRDPDAPVHDGLGFQVPPGRSALEPA